MTLRIPFDNTYARLPERFYAKMPPAPVAAPTLIRVNEGLAEDLGIDPAALASSEGLAVLSGNAVAEGSEPLAQAYAGHQFGGFSPQLGDGRALLLGEVVGKQGRRDIALKGSGPTPFSRRGDGRAALGPVLREYVVSEAMAALGLPTSRALAAVLTGETVRRERALPGAIFTRVAASHLRIGTFQYFAARNDTEALRILADYAIDRHYPQARHAPSPYRALLEAVTRAQAELIARWLHIGFIHGVMNTDNMTISGETIDFGPCAFMDGYDSRRVLSSIDHHGRYAYGNQPNIGFWNLTRLAETLIPLLGADEESGIAVAKEALEPYVSTFQTAYDAGLCRKIGLSPSAQNTEIAHALLTLMGAHEADFTLTFRSLSDALSEDNGEAAFRALFTAPDAPSPDDWLLRWRQSFVSEEASPETRQADMRATNPAFIPRNHIMERVIVAAVDSHDFKPFETFLDVLSQPYADQPARADYALPPKPEERVLQTFCGT